VEEYNEDLPDRFYFSVAAVAVAGFITVGQSLPFWLALPFDALIRAAVFWSEFSLSFSALSVPIMSLWHLLLGVVACGLVYTLCLGAILKTSLIASDMIATRATPAGFHFVLFLLFIGAAVLRLLVGT
jgi:hypothetical protein